MDTYDHLSEEDLPQAVAIMAVFVHHTAERDERMPLKALELAQPEQPGSGGLGVAEMMEHYLNHMH